MKKTTSFLLASLFLATSTVCFAKPQDFSDYYGVSASSGAALQLLSSSVISGPVTVISAGAANFIINETGHPAGPGGVVNVVVGTDNAHSCTLTIQDVDFEIPVLLSKACSGGYSVASFNAGYNNTSIVIQD